MVAADETINFLRTRDYKFERFLDKGKGATGETALLRDEQLDMLFVCKKYSVEDPLRRSDYYRRFVGEVRLLFGAFHPNVVRVFSCYLFPIVYKGFIIMEYIDGTDLRTYLEGNPDQANALFTQTIAAFQHLEEKNILHRDIRPSNIMVSNDGVVKVIDFGFGKRVDTSEGFGKSITLNWAATEPKEFEYQKYDFCTECYFVGKLYQSVVKDLGITNFSYSDVRKYMTEYDPVDRIRSFAEVASAILTDTSSTDQFSETNREIYRVMADFLMRCVVEIHAPFTLQRDAEKVLTSLKALEESSQLESRIQDVRPLISSFISTGFRFKTPSQMLEVEDLKRFLNFFQTQTEEGRRIILSNLSLRFATIFVTEPDDIPF